MADTTAWLKCIRELAGLKTGYTTEDLKEGKFYFAKIRRSELVRKAETAARLTGLSRGANTQTAAKALFGESDTMRIGLQELAAQEIEPDPFLEASAETVIIEAEVVPQKSTRDILITVMEHYQAESLLPKNMITFTENILTWLHKTDDAEKKTDLWNKAIDRLRKIEETIPEKARVTHGLYK